MQKIGVDLAKEQKLNYGDDMTSVLRQARKRRFQLKEEQRIAQDIELQTYLNQLLIEDAQRNLEALKEKQEAEGRTEAELAEKREELEEKKESCITRLNDLFAKVDDRRRVSFIS